MAAYGEIPMAAVISLSEHQRWSEDRVAGELEAWSAKRCFEQWPPYREEEFSEAVPR
jgi:hypothetical protein